MHPSGRLGHRAGAVMAGMVMERCAEDVRQRGLGPLFGITDRAKPAMPQPDRRPRDSRPGGCWVPGWSGPDLTGRFMPPRIQGWMIAMPGRRPPARAGRGSRRGMRAAEMRDINAMTRGYGSVPRMGFPGGVSGGRIPPLEVKNARGSRSPSLSPDRTVQERMSTPPVSRE